MGARAGLPLAERTDRKIVRDVEGAAQPVGGVELCGVESFVVRVSILLNHVRPHQHLQSATPAEVWARVDPYVEPVKQAFWFEAWDGLLQGYYLRR